MIFDPGTPAASGDYFYTPALKALVQQLSHLAFFGDGISVVLGPPGSGKSMLCGELQREFSSAYSVANIRLEADVELIESIKKVSDALGVFQSQGPGEAIAVSIGEMLAALRHYVQALAQDKKLVVLIIDDAQHLDEQSIGALISLLQGGNEANCGLHLVLLSEPGLERRIDSLQIVDVAVYDFDMPNFSPSELASFLDSHCSSSATLNSAKLQKIWGLAHGYPGVALIHAEEDVQPSSEGRPETLSWLVKIRKSLPVAHMVAISVLIAVLVLSVFMQEDETETISMSPKVPVSAPNSALPSANNSPQPSLTKPPKTMNLSEPNATYGADGEVGRGLRGAAVEPQSASVNDERQSAEPSISSTPAHTVLPAASVVNTFEAEGDSSSNQQAMPQASASVDQVIPTIEATQALDSSAANKAQAAPIALNAEEVFLMSQNPEFFTLQVIAAGKKTSLDSYIQSQENKESLRMYRGKRDGKRWYVVVQGVYSTREMALNALKKLPQEQVQAGPWPRKFSAVQEEIETFRRN